MISYEFFFLGNTLLITFNSSLKKPIFAVEKNALIMALRNNPFKPITRAIPAPFKNKYFIVLGFFFMWMVFFDKHQFNQVWGLSQKVNQMEADRD